MSARRFAPARLPFLVLWLPWLLAWPAAAAGSATGEAGSGPGTIESPVIIQVRLKPSQVAAARDGRLGLAERTGKTASHTVAPVQWDPADTGLGRQGVWLRPTGAAGQMQLTEPQSRTPFERVMQASRDLASGQVDITDEGRPVLRYNYKAVEPGELLDKVTPANRIYTRARSDYIHPLYGLEGEVLTRDWSIDHPHHRGIYWAWPEVDYGTERGDLHALQRVFACPTGKLRLQGGPVFAQIEAENLWLWEEREAIVRERAIIRAYRRTPQGRLVDLAFQFVALKDGVTLARRGTEHYGGLNVRMATPAAQDIFVHTDPTNAMPRRAWSDLSGVFGAAGTPSGLGVFQLRADPDYPGDWIQYPALSWCQPTFPAAGTRYPLPRGKALELHYRLLIHAGPRPGDDLTAKLWDAFQASDAAVPRFSGLDIAK